MPNANTWPWRTPAPQAQRRIRQILPSRERERRSVARQFAIGWFRWRGRWVAWSWRETPPQIGGRGRSKGGPQAFLFCFFVKSFFPKPHPLFPLPPPPPPPPPTQLPPPTLSTSPHPHLSH